MVIGSAIFGVPIFIILALFFGAVAAFNSGDGGIGNVGCIAVIGLLIIIAFALLSLLSSGM